MILQEEITLNTPITKLRFPQSPRLVKAVEKYNNTVDKKNRLNEVKDLKVNDPEYLIELLGVGPKTVENFVEHLKAHKLW